MTSTHIPAVQMKMTSELCVHNMTMINMATITENNLDIHMRMCQGKNTIQTNKEQKIAVIYG